MMEAHMMGDAYKAAKSAEVPKTEGWKPTEGTREFTGEEIEKNQAELAAEAKKHADEIEEARQAALDTFKTDLEYLSPSDKPTEELKN